MVSRWITRILKIILGVFILIVVIGAVGEGVIAAVELAAAAVVRMAHDHLLASRGHTCALPAAVR